MSFRSRRVVLAPLAAFGALVLVSSVPAAVGAGASEDRAVATAIAHLEANPASVGATRADVGDLAVADDAGRELDARGTLDGVGARLDGRDERAVEVQANRRTVGVLAESEGHGSSAVSVVAGPGFSAGKRSGRA